MSHPLLLTKLLAPSPRAGIIMRQALVDRLNLGLNCRLTLISAPAGFGKTTLLSSWMAQAAPSLHIAWLTLDPDDDDATRFLEYLTAALQHADPALGEATSRLLTADETRSTDQIVTELVNELTHFSNPLVLVLDDYHCIDAQAVHAIIGFLLEHGPPGLRLMMATREDPPLALARLRADSQLTEIRLHDLRFTSEDATRLFNESATLDLTAEDVAVLEARTEGWPAGLSMAALALQSVTPDGVDPSRQRTRFIQAFAGSNRYVFDYLVEEVLQRQPQAVQEFLLQTSILSQLTAPLCAAVTAQDNAKATLQRLERTNLFVIPLDSTRTRYRYHRLFADLLQAQLHSRYAAEDVANLHRRASNWFEKACAIESAIDHALAAKDFFRALTLIGQIIEETFARGETATLLRWLDRVPQEQLLLQPEVCLYQAWALLMNGYPLDVVHARLLRIAQQSPQGSANTQPLRASLALIQGDVEAAITLAQSALDQLPGERNLLRSFAQLVLGMGHLVAGRTADGLQFLEQLIRHQQRGNPLVIVKVFCNLAEYNAKHGRLRKAHDLYAQALDLANAGVEPDAPLAVDPLTGLGEVAAMHGDWDSAARYLTRSVELARRNGQIGELNGLISLATVCTVQGDPDRAQTLLERAMRLARRFDATEIDDLMVALAQVRLWLEQGRLDEVEAWARARGLWDDPTGTGLETPDEFIRYHLRKYEQLVAARLCLAQDNPAAALARLEALLPVVIQLGRIPLEIEVQLLRALAFQAQGRQTETMTALTDALHLAQPEEYLAPFLSEQHTLAPLLQQLPLHVPTRAFVQRLLTLHSTAPGNPSHITSAAEQLPETLTAREQEILQLLATELTVPEMARLLTVADSTVRTHVKHIYAKLGTSRRIEAVNRAQSLGLIGGVAASQD